MDPFFKFARIDIVKLFFQKILYSLDVMISYSFCFLDQVRIFQRKLLGNRHDLFSHMTRNSKDFFLRKEQEIFYFHNYPIFYQGKFRKVVSQMLNLPTISAIDRANCG